MMEYRRVNVYFGCKPPIYVLANLRTGHFMYAESASVMTAYEIKRATDSVCKLRGRETLYQS